MKELDLMGQQCPMPVLYTKKALNGMASGEVITVTCSDPATQEDIAGLCRTMGHELVSSTVENDKFIFVIRKN